MNYSYKFKNGSSINGNVAQIMEVAKILGEEVDAAQLGIIPKGYYMSETKGLIKISDMNPLHIKNALTKATYTYFQNIGKEKISLKEYLQKFLAFTDSEQIVDLFEELVKQAEKE